VPESLPRNAAQPFAWNRINPFAALLRLARRPDIRGLLVCYTLLSFAQMMLQSTWVLYTTFRFGWTPRENGLSLFCVGVCSIVVQAGLLAMLIRRFGEMRLAMAGLASGAVTYLLYGLATQGWMMYVFILCNMLAYAAGPALQASVQVDRRGRTGRIDGIPAIDRQPGPGRHAAARQRHPRRRQPLAGAGLAHRRHLLRVRGDAGRGPAGGLAPFPRAAG
jgi:hypothetical protein